jgi:molybdenum cofactor cytidylyltransferase
MGNEMPADDLKDHSAPGGDGSGPIAAIVLAAGRSSRMGQHKLLLPLGDRPVIAHVVAAACSSDADPVLIVLGHEAEQVRATLPSTRIREVENSSYIEGMASSLRAGIAAVPAECAGALVVLGDQPLITAALLDRLIASARRAPGAIVAATYAGRRGSPVYFPRRDFAALEAVDGDEGGRSVLAQHPDRVRLVECADVGTSLDVDTPEDYERIREAWDAWRRRLRDAE